MKVLVTGGSGFIGSKLSKKLIERGYDVLSYDLKTSKVCEFIIGDITDPARAQSIHRSACTLK